MRFVDSSVFLYAYLRPKRYIDPKTLKAKENAKNIIKRINEGERVLTTVVHLSEISNILEAKENTEIATKIIAGILQKTNIKVLDVSKKTYTHAVNLANKLNLGINDSLAIIVMKKHKINEIYSFDKDFDRIKEIKRITE